ncbi:MAG: hypothetical protein KTR30_12170 [Saprospiraceae bacterium]|nr:hypothetical protein [Saprospiraceae bacterium]
MKPFQANLVNAAVLIILGLWGYLGSETPSATALIPVGFGVIFALATPPFKKENKVVAHIIVLLTLLIIIALFMPLRGALGRGDTVAAARVGIMIATSIVAMVIYIKSFIDARKAREAGE